MDSRGLFSLLPSELSAAFLRLRLRLSLISRSVRLPSALSSVNPTVTISVDQFGCNDSARHLFMSRADHHRPPSFSLAPNQTIHDSFNGVGFTRTSSSSFDDHSLHHSSHHDHANLVHSSYVPHVLTEATTPNPRSPRLFNKRPMHLLGCERNTDEGTSSAVRKRRRIDVGPCTVDDEQSRRGGDNAAIEALEGEQIQEEQQAQLAEEQGQEEEPRRQERPEEGGGARAKDEVVLRLFGADIRVSTLSIEG